MADFSSPPNRSQAQWPMVAENETFRKRTDGRVSVYLWHRVAILAAGAPMALDLDGQSRLVRPRAAILCTCTDSRGVVHVGVSVGASPSSDSCPWRPLLSEHSMDSVSVVASPSSDSCMATTAFPPTTRRRSRLLRHRAAILAARPPSVFSAESTSRLLRHRAAILAVAILCAVVARLYRVSVVASPSSDSCTSLATPEVSRTCRQICER